jgi:hypothetical protein
MVDNEANAPAPLGFQLIRLAGIPVAFGSKGVSAIVPESSVIRRALLDLPDDT